LAGFGSVGFAVGGERRGREEFEAELRGFYYDCLDCFFGEMEDRVYDYG
jgi:hypothetical protein